MVSIYIKDDTRRRAEKGILYDFLADDGSESREAAEIIHARYKEFCVGIPSSDEYRDLKLSVEALTGGKNTVILDDRGLPSVMVLLPKMDSANLSNGLISRTHPAFIVDNKEYDTIAVGKYASVVKDGRAYSMPFQDPATCYNFDESAKLCRDKGNGWGITPYALWGALGLWCKKNSTMPEGNTNYGQFNDDKNSTAPSACVDADGRTEHTLTGAGPLSWYHNHQYDGIADLCGNVFEWCSGFRWCNGELQMIPNADSMNPDCDMSFASDRWRAILPDGTYTNPGNPDSLKLDYIDGRWMLCQNITSFSEEKRCGIMREIGLADGLTEVPQILIELGICPERELTGAPYGNDVFWGPNQSPEQFPCKGGNWYDYIYGCGGIFRTSVYYGRELRGNTIGMRLAYYK